jgi:hypothetical protein
MQKPSDIAYTKDIAESVANELGLSRQFVEDHIDFIVHWVKKLTQDPDVLTINIPSVGRLYLNWNKVYKYYNNQKNSEDDLKSSRLIAFNLNEKKLESFDKVFGDKKGYNRHRKRSKFSSTYFNKGKSLRELEEWQNSQ